MAYLALNSNACPIEDTGPDGPLVIEPETSRILVAVIITLFGAAFTAVPAFMVVAALRSKFWMGAVCPGIFMLVGLFLDMFALNMLLKCFNPKPILALSQKNIYPGTEFEISWMFKGNTHAIRKLTLTLIGKEKASYRQGTSTRTEESTFFKQVIIETEDPTTIAKGFELVQLPQDTMHSFKSDNNEIVWLVQTDGDVAWWPDLDDAFPFRVLTPFAEELEHA
jgi:hypothetical protein